MKNYQTQNTLRLPSGVVVGLTPEQAASRLHVLIQQADGVYIATTPLQFKSGEVIGLDAVPNGLAEQLAVVELAEQDGDEGSDEGSGEGGGEGSGEGGGEGADEGAEPPIAPKSSARKKPK